MNRGRISTLDTSTAQTRLDLSRRDLDVQRATLQSARAAFALAESDYQRTKQLREQGRTRRFVRFVNAGGFQQEALVLGRGGRKLRHKGIGRRQRFRGGRVRLGWLHAGDRFFQMEMRRRYAAGRVAEVLGPSGFAADVDARREGHARLAARDEALLGAEDREAASAYAEGVNAGLAARGERPFESLLLPSEPRRRRTETSLLASLATFGAGFGVRPRTGVPVTPRPAAVTAPSADVGVVI